MGVGKFVWVCPKCGKKFENFFAYVLHMEWHEREERERERGNGGICKGSGGEVSKEVDS